ncbi:MAG TPA: class I SAM-dependent methyltransferase [Verrucomicrobiae bacterium]|jgi:SAM-dependent methyltransferase|nr:class I SAM-dependent methyltransferase [Verrucomicrobiae bacterium]
MLVLDELKKIGRSPGRLREVFRLRRWRQFFSILGFNSRAGNRWKTAPGAPALKQREYSSYEQYVEHQQSKFKYLDLADYDVNYRRLLKERLQGLPIVKHGANALCLGARQGTEVKAFLDLGCFAIGLDLNPGKENPFVLQGDFHHTQFPSQSVDIIFTNSFDHAFDPQKLIAEIKRLLKPDGALIIEAIHGEAESDAPDNYASFWWQRVDDLVALLASNDFNLVRRIGFNNPWPGEQICFELQTSEAKS